MKLFHTLRRLSNRSMTGPTICSGMMPATSLVERGGPVDDVVGEVAASAVDELVGRHATVEQRGGSGEVLANGQLGRLAAGDEGAGDRDGAGHFGDGVKSCVSCVDLVELGLQLLGSVELVSEFCFFGVGTLGL